MNEVAMSNAEAGWWQRLWKSRAKGEYIVCTGIFSDESSVPICGIDFLRMFVHPKKKEKKDVLIRCYSHHKKCYNYVWMFICRFTEDIRSTHWSACRRVDSVVTVCSKHPWVVVLWGTEVIFVVTKANKHGLLQEVWWRILYLFTKLNTFSGMFLWGDAFSIEYSKGTVVSFVYSIY